MKTVKKLTVVAAISATVFAGVFIAQAHNSGENDALAAQSATITLDNAVYTALATVPGKATKAEFSNDDDENVWEIEIAGNDHRVHDVEINARNGIIVKNEIDHADHENDDDDDDDENRDEND